VRNYYELIGVAHAATAAEIKARYRALSKSYHPDAGGSEAQMAQLNEAYRVLMNPVERASYDRQLTRERDAARAAAARRQQAAQQAHARTTAKHKEARAYAQQNEAIFADIHPQKSPKKSSFWKFMAWSTAVYVIAGAALLYALTMPSMASNDTTETSKPATPLAQEAANASAAISDAPSSVTETQLPTQGSAPTTTTSNTDTSSQNDNSDDTTSNSATSQPDTTQTSPEQPTKKHANWRRYLPF